MEDPPRTRDPPRCRYCGAHVMTADKYNDARIALINDPSASYWLKRAVNELDARDPVDAQHDAELLATLAALRTHSVFAAAREQFPEPPPSQCHSSGIPPDKET